MIFGATFESDLELATQVLVVLVTDQITKQRFGVRPNIESFRRRGAGPVARRDVAHSVATGLTRGYSGPRQETQQVRSFFQFDVIDLRVFARGEVNKATAKSISRIGQPH